MYIIKQLKNNFAQLFYLGLSETVWGSGKDNDVKQSEKKEDKTNLEDYKDHEWYKKLSVEQQQVVDNKIEKKIALEKKIAQMTAEVSYKWIKSDIISKWIEKNKPLAVDEEDKEEIMTFESRVDNLNRDIDGLEKEIYNVKLELNSENLEGSFEKSNTYFKEKFADSLGDWKKSEYVTQLLEKKDLKTITAWEAYTLKQEWYDLSGLFLAWWDKIVSKKEMSVWNKFTVNFWGNSSLNNSIWAGDLIPIDKIDKVRINWVDWTRRYDPRPWYYSESWKYLSVFDNYKVEIISEKEVTPEELEKSKNAFKLRFDEIRGTELSTKFRDLIETAWDVSSIKLDSISKSDMEYLKTYMSKYIPKDQLLNIDFDIEKWTVSTKNWKSLSGFMKESLPRWAWYEKYKAIVEQVAAKYPEIWADKLATLINHENGKWDPLAWTPWSSAYWLWQMIDSTWKTYWKWLDRNNPADQLDATCRYLKDIMSRKKCPIEIAMAYYNTWEWILSLSDSKISHIASINPAITRKIPWWSHIDAKTYLTWAVAYYNDISFWEASSKV